jgi:hypothetical protein
VSDWRTAWVTFVTAVVCVAPTSWGQGVQSKNTLRLDEGAKPGAGTIADAAWLAGRWVAEGEQTISEETWSPPRGKHMIGMFQILKKADESIIFTEHFVLAEEDESLILRLKHFDPSFHGWEEKDGLVAFRLVRVEPGAVFFDGLTMKRREDGGMDAFVAVKNRESGEIRELGFAYKKAP